ncbi:hypothetical protein [Ahrensia kielensis]|uniref:hypothetical protein n=1 Tax=Ahrensia kielensis TaxID=76980 RepID=UPI001FE1CAFE|nr:hypothetical protein [Ahrensia kielensis]
MMKIQVFKSGQMVSLLHRDHLSPATPKLFRVENRLPDTAGASQYRIKNDEQNHERVELGSNLVVAENAN